jgi:salicylate hydroxylase
MVSGLPADRDEGVADRYDSGIKSLGREIVLGFGDKPMLSVYACFRVYFKGAYLKEDPFCREFVEKECVNGNDTHLV